MTLTLNSDDVATYVEFVVEILRTGPERRLVTTLGDHREGVRFESPVDTDLLHSGRTWAQRSTRLDSAGYARSLGRQLFGSLVSERGTRLVYERAVEQGMRPGTGVRVRLDIADPDIDALPWELLYDDKVLKDFIALSTGWSVVRGPVSSEAGEPLQAAPPPLRVLAMVTPPGRGLDEDRIITRAVSEAPGVEFDVLDRPSEVLDRLTDVHPHVLHCQGQVVNSDTLREALSQYGDVRLVVVGVEDSLRLAEYLSRAVPAVVGWAGPIDPSAYQSFMRAFYQSLSQGNTVEGALRNGRRQIDSDQPGGREWATPVCYLRTGGALLGPPAPLGKSVELPGVAAGPDSD
ncbi:MAG: hypothetical protein ACRD0K_20645, partial [Egibacteraceae bacterium]